TTSAAQTAFDLSAVKQSGSGEGCRVADLWSRESALADLNVRVSHTRPREFKAQQVQIKTGSVNRKFGQESSTKRRNFNHVAQDSTTARRAMYFLNKRCFHRVTFLLVTHAFLCLDLNSCPGLGRKLMPAFGFEV